MRIENWVAAPIATVTVLLHIFMVMLFVTAPAAATSLANSKPTSQAIPVPKFVDPDRVARLSAAFPELDRIFDNWRVTFPAPGVVYGVIVDGALVHAAAFGERDVATHAAATVDTVFRIASLTKSFTALAIVRLRDEGRLQLDDPVDKYVPDLANLAYPTRDSPRITIRQLLSHQAGLPEDNPWADRQLSIDPARLSSLMRAGIPFSHEPATTFEYSNYGFMILGRVIAAASGRPYRDYVDASILQPLGMTSTVWGPERIATDRIATGHRREGESWVAEPALENGDAASIGGLYSSIPDLARYVAFYLSAFPPRDDADWGPVRRSSLREMQMPISLVRATARRARVGAPLDLTTGGYGFGLVVAQSCGFGQIVSHNGGLPGFGARMVWLPEYGVGIVALTDRTYGTLRPAIDAAFAALERTGALKPRAAQPSATLLAARRAVDTLYAKWDGAALEAVAADNLLLDRPLTLRRQDFADLHARLGGCAIADPSAVLEVENALRGRWTLACEHGRLRFALTLSPTPVPAIQHLEASAVLPLESTFAAVVAQLAKHLGEAPADPLPFAVDSSADAAAISREIVAAEPWGACQVGDTIKNDGTFGATVRLKCNGGALDAAIEWNRGRRALTSVRLTPSPEETCVP